MKQKIIFTALPNGINPANKNLKLSVAISLQVLETDEDTKLSAVPDMLNWADLINKAKFVVQVNGTNVDAKIVSSAVDVSLWKALFSPTVKVNAFVQPDKTKVPIYSYPVKHIMAYLKFIVEHTGKRFHNDMPDAGFYTNNPFFTGISNYRVVEYPKTRRFKPTIETLAPSSNNGAKIKRTYLSKPFIPFSAEPNPTSDFAQLCHFHGLYDIKERDKFIQFEKPDFEFHDIISVLTQYPKLMRKLGLVFDLEISVRNLISPAVITPSVRIIPNGLNFSTPTTIVCPATAFELTSKGFYKKAEAGSFHDKGHVKINTSAFTVFQIDTDGAALKLTSHIDALQLKKAKHYLYAYNGMLPDEKGIPLYNNEQTPRREGLPSNRTAGIAIARNGMAEYLNGRFVKMDALKTVFSTIAAAPSGVANTNAKYVLGAQPLFADDVNIGYRVDVIMTDKVGKADTWHSLHFNENTYSFKNSLDVSVTINDIGQDEGFIQLSTSEDAKIEGPHMKVSEVIARWEGWSLAVPMPGLALNEPTLNDENPVEPNPAAEAAKFQTPANVPFKLNVYPVVAKGTLPKLRFGKTYSLKIRTVDMAGNSVPFDSNPENETEAIVSNIKYMRYEPVDTPFLIPGNVIKDGESSEVLVIRSNEGVSVKAYEDDVNNKDKVHTIPYNDKAIRHVKPPRTTVGMSITHGMLEHAIGVGAAERQAVYEKITNDKDPEVEGTTGTNDIPFDKNAIAHVIDGDALSIPVEYLADPMAAGVSFCLSALDPNPKANFADVKKLSKRCSFYFSQEVKTDADANKEFDSDNKTDTVPVKSVFNAWINPKTFRIVLKEGDDITVDWSSTERIISITVPKGFMLKLNYACFWKPKDVLQLSGILNMMNMTSLTDEVGRSIAEGRHWMFSPWRTITFVHAVQQPITKLAGKTYPFINGIKPERNYGDNFAGIGIDIDIHGASTGVVDIQADWVDWVDDVNDLTKNGVQQINKKAKVYHYTALYHVYKYVFGELVKGNPFKAVQHQFNDTKHRWVNYQVVASTRYKECFFNLLSDKKDLDIIRPSNVIEQVNILSSARPITPQIAYVIPNFEWSKKTVGDTSTNFRWAGLRIYFKRPWYSSGEGEKLAIVLAPPMNAATLLRTNTEPVEKVCTTWGNDPTKTTSISGSIFPGKTAFLGVKKADPVLYTEDGLTIDELVGFNVSIVAYDVQFDVERQLYFADIMMNFGTAYFPFIRLALAAYQQHSIRKENKDCCLSKIVQADYIQIPPPRLTSLTKKGTEITVAITGPLPNLANTGNYVTKIEFVIEPLDLPANENVVININTKAIETYTYFIKNSDLTNSTFNHSKKFKLMPADAAKPYRVKIFEYEMITYDPRRPNPNPGGFIGGNLPMKERLVFADVYEVYS